MIAQLAGLYGAAWVINMLVLIWFFTWLDIAPVDSIATCALVLTPICLILFLSHAAIAKIRNP